MFSSVFSGIISDTTFPGILVIFTEKFLWYFEFVFDVFKELSLSFKKFENSDIEFLFDKFFISDILRRDIKSNLGRFI